MKIISVLLLYVMKFISIIYPYSLNHRLCYYRNVIYTLWIKSFIGKIGEHSMICYPCLISGGGQKDVLIGNNTLIEGHSILSCHEEYRNQKFTPSLIIGNNCNIGEYNHFSVIMKITIGDGLLTGRYVYIGDNAHGGLSHADSMIPPVERQLCSKGEIIIGNNVWIGDKATILGGVTVGNNVIIAANSVVTKSVESNCVVAGIPARVVKSL